MGNRVREVTWLDPDDAQTLEDMGKSKSAFIREAVEEKLDRIEVTS